MSPLPTACIRCGADTKPILVLTRGSNQLCATHRGVHNQMLVPTGRAEGQECTACGAILIDEQTSGWSSLARSVLGRLRRKQT